MLNVRESEEISLSSLPVKVVCKLGSVELSILELQRLAPGCVFPIACSTSEMMDIIANGQRIGYGALVRTGDTFAVKITRLISRD